MSQAIQQLIAQWRERARRNAGPYLKARLAQIQCADELEALLLQGEARIEERKTCPGDEQ
jgi:hypothetical protein